MYAVVRDSSKYPLIVLASALMTFLLFYFMQTLVALDNDRQQTIDVIRIVDATVPDFPDLELFTEVFAPEPVEDYEYIEVDTGPRESTGFEIFIPRVQAETPEIETNPGDVALADNILVPLIRTTGNYPQRALARGIEGFVELSFTVDELGNVAEPIVVLNAVPEGMFERSAIQAIKRWKYSPAIENGVAVPTTDVRQRIVYQMDTNPR